MAVGQNPVPLVNVKIGGKWMFIHPKMARHRLCPMAILWAVGTPCVSFFGARSGFRAAFTMAMAMSSSQGTHWLGAP